MDFPTARDTLSQMLGSDREWMGCEREHFCLLTVPVPRLVSSHALDVSLLAFSGTESV